jgi:hypothetical protein
MLGLFVTLATIVDMENGVTKTERGCLSQIGAE